MNKRKSKSLKDYNKILEEISMDVLICKIKCELDLNENIKVKSIRKSNESDWHIFEEEDQDISNHKEFANKVQRRFSSKNVKNSSEIDVYLDEKSRIVYLKDNEFFFNGKYLRKLSDDAIHNLFDPSFQDPQLFIEKFSKDYQKSLSDSDLFSKLETMVSSSIRSFIIDQKLEACSFDSFKLNFIIKYKPIHFDIINNIIYSKFNENSKSDLQKFVKKKVNLLDNLFINCSKEELLVKLVICSFPAEERKLLFNNLDYRKECLIKRSQDLISIKNAKSLRKKVEVYTLFTDDESSDDEKKW